MGNCLPPANTQSENKLTNNEHHGPADPEITQKVRFGIEGLSDCGFEYRQVSHQCPEEVSLPETRLFHTTTGVMITPHNRKTYIPDGAIFDKVSQCCQQISQQRLQDQYGMKWMHLFSFEGHSVQALGSPSYLDDDATEGRHRPVLAIFTGKGKSRAGVLSVRELLVSGLERGSALYHVQQAVERGWSVILLDPNARGKSEGSVVMKRSLDHFLESEGKKRIDRPVYILAHSAAGGYLARYLLEGKHRQVLHSYLEGLVFTDSTHNLQWAKDDSAVSGLLQSRKCLYIRNCSENPSDTFANHKNKKAGEVHIGNSFWYRRFGDIPTVWAGTTDHSSMCWVARGVIWSFFDERNQNSTRGRKKPITPSVYDPTHLP